LQEDVYIASVGVGSPATYYDLVADINTPDTWVGAQSAHPYIKTSTSHFVSPVNIDGQYEGELYTDRLTLSPELVANNQGVGSVSVILKPYHAPSLNGTLGLGLSGLAFPAVPNTLAAQGKIPSARFALYFQPETQTSAASGTLSFGDTDSSKYTGSLQYVPLVSLSLWVIRLSITYNEGSILSGTLGVVDSVSSSLGLPRDAFNRYKAATGAEYDDEKGLLKIATEQYAALQPLDFVIGGVAYSLPPEAQVLDIGTPGTLYLSVFEFSTVCTFLKLISAHGD
jgi:hypothetical protein